MIGAGPGPDDQFQLLGTCCPVGLYVCMQKDGHVPFLAPGRGAAGPVTVANLNLKSKLAVPAIAVNQWQSGRRPYRRWHWTRRKPIGDGA